MKTSQQIQDYNMYRKISENMSKIKKKKRMDSLVLGERHGSLPPLTKDKRSMSNARLKTQLRKNSDSIEAPRKRKRRNRSAHPKKLRGSQSIKHLVGESTGDVIKVINEQ